MARTRLILCFSIQNQQSVKGDNKSKPDKITGNMTTLENLKLVKE